MISIFHPSLIFCTGDVQWDNHDFKDSFIENLFSHIDRIEELKIKIAWSDDFFNCFWQNSPWMGDAFYENHLIEVIYHKMANLFEIINQPPDVECQINPDIQTNLDSKVRRYWLILIHRLLHNQEKTLVIVGLNIKNGMGSVEVFCGCGGGSYRDRYLVLKNPSEWYSRISYMEKCPDLLDGWEDDFRLAIKMCREQKFNMGQFKTDPENIEFNDRFKKTFLKTSLSGKKGIIKSITKRLTLNYLEACQDTSLREHKVTGKEEFRFYASRGGRIHYMVKGNKIKFLEYFPPSKHDAGL